MSSGLFNFFRGRKEPASRDVAKQRLQLVLVHDRANISPGLLETLKDEIIDVISKRVEIDGAATPDHVSPRLALKANWWPIFHCSTADGESSVNGPASKSDLTQSPHGVNGSPMNDPRLWRHFDWVLLLVVVLLVGYGVTMIYSATLNVENPGRVYDPPGVILCSRFGRHDRRGGD